MPYDFKFQGGPAWHAFPVTRSNTEAIQEPTQAKHVPIHGFIPGQAGTIALVPMSGVGSITLTVSAHIQYHVGATWVFSTGTTVTTIVGLT